MACGCCEAHAALTALVAAEHLKAHGDGGAADVGGGALKPNTAALQTAASPRVWRPSLRGSAPVAPRAAIRPDASWRADFQVAPAKGGFAPGAPQRQLSGRRLAECCPLSAPRSARTAAGARDAPRWQEPQPQGGAAHEDRRHDLAPRGHGDAVLVARSALPRPRRWVSKPPAPAETSVPAGAAGAAESSSARAAESLCPEDAMLTGQFSAAANLSQESAVRSPACSSLGSPAGSRAADPGATPAANLTAAPGGSVAASPRTADRELTRCGSLPGVAHHVAGAAVAPLLVRAVSSPGEPQRFDLAAGDGEAAEQDFFPELSRAAVLEGWVQHFDIAGEDEDKSDDEACSTCEPPDSPAWTHEDLWKLPEA